MIRAAARPVRANAFSIFLTKTRGTLVGQPPRVRAAKIAKLYHALPASEKLALKQAAEKVTYKVKTRKVGAFAKFVAANWKLARNVPVTKRLAVLAKKYQARK